MYIEENGEGEREGGEEGGSGSSKHKRTLNQHLSFYSKSLVLTSIECFREVVFTQKVVFLRGAPNSCKSTRIFWQVDAFPYLTQI